MSPRSSGACRSTGRCWSRWAIRTSATSRGSEASGSSTSVAAEPLGAVGLRERQSREGEEVDRYALGLHHLALGAPDRETVDRIAAWAQAEGVEIESGPREYDYTPGYYAVFLRDPDNLKLEVVHR